jgi:hypothetical protein
MAFPVALALMGLQALSKFMQAKGQQRKPLDMNMLEQMFGPGAVNQELMGLFNHAMASSQGQQLMGSAAEEGQAFQNDLERRAGAAGLGPAGGASGGADVFASAGAGQAGNNLQRGMRASLMQSMLPVAQQMVQSRMQAYLGDREAQQARPTMMETMGGFGSDLATNLLAQYKGKEPAADPNAIIANNGGVPGDAGNPNVQPRGMTPGLTPSAPVPVPSLQPLSYGAPSMGDVQGQIGRGMGRSRFASKMSRFGGNMGSAVQFA